MLCEKISGRAPSTTSKASGTPRKSGVRTSTEHSGTRAWTASITAAQWRAPPSGRSSRSTEVITAWRRPIAATAVARLAGSSASTPGRGRPEVTAQKPQRRVQISPRIMKVAVPSSPQHS